MTAKVPISESGTVNAGITVAHSSRRKMKMTMMTSTIVPIRVIFTSVKLSRMDLERSITVDSLIEGGMPACRPGSLALIWSTS